MGVFDEMTARHSAESQRRLEAAADKKLKEDQANQKRRAEAVDYLSKNVAPLLSEAKIAFIKSGVGFSIVDKSTNKFVEPHLLVTIGGLGSSGDVVPPIAGTLGFSVDKDQLSVSRGLGTAAAQYGFDDTGRVIEAEIEKLLEAYYKLVE